MTCREKLKIELPNRVKEEHIGGCYGCPDHYGYASTPEGCHVGDRNPSPEKCYMCWDREIPGTEETINAPKILDSGTRREFESGAVRDIQEGKGRCDLLPLDVVAKLMTSKVQEYILICIKQFQVTGNDNCLYAALWKFVENTYLIDANGLLEPICHMILEVSKHFEEGAKKYGEDNWQKGIPTHCYIDSAVRHYLKWLRGDKDEPHDRAFCWNILCCIWTCKHKPELNDYLKKEVEK